jgi:hypothetical protein
MFGKMAGQLQRLVAHIGTLKLVPSIWNKLVEVTALSKSIEWKSAVWRLDMAQVSWQLPVCGG